MSNSIDERIVEMTFTATNFVKGVQQTLTALNSLKTSLNFKNEESSLASLENAGNKFSLAGMGNAISTVGSKFSLLGTAGAIVLGNLATKAVTAGVSIVKALTLDPVKAGFDVYETKINAIQTILANTASAGVKLPQVTAALADLNKYANLTVYSFGDMTKNIGTFTAAGVDLNTSVQSIKGIANLAALSGSTAEQASTAMYQLSQAIAAGSVKLQDWNSVVNAGLGGKVFQNALETTARATGVNIDAIIAKAGSFRNSLQQGWLTSKILTQTLSTFTGDLSAQQLKAMGYTAQEAAQIEAQGKTALASATNIKTVTQLFQALKEEVATAWASVFEQLLGGIGSATKTLSAVHNVLENLFTKPIYDLSNLLTEWNKLGGRDKLIYAISDAFKILESYLKPVGQAFRDVFPPTTAIDLMNLVLLFENFLDAIRPTAKTLQEIRSVFDGLFSVVKIGVDLVTGLFKGLTEVGSGAASAGTGLLGLLAKLGDFLVKIKNAIESSNAISTIFSVLGKVIAAPLNAIGNASNVFSSFGNIIQAVWAKVEPFVVGVGQEFAKLGPAIAKAIQSGGFSNVLTLLNQGLFASILLAFRKFVKNLGGDKESVGLLGSIKESFEGLTGALKSMQTNLKSGTLEKIAISVGILAASLLVLSLINIKDLTKSLTAMTIMFGEMLVALSVVTKISGSAGIIKLPVVAASLILLSTAILVLSAAVAILAQFSWTQLAKGLGAIAVLLLELVTAVALLSKDTKGLYSTAIAIEVIAVAMNIMAGAVKKLGSLDWTTLAKGIGTIAALLLIIAGFNAISAGGLELVTTAAAMVILGAALNIMAAAIGTLGALSWGAIAKGLVAITDSLVLLAAAMIVMDGTLPGAAALVIAALAIQVLAGAMVTLGGMSWTDIAQALVALAGSLVLIAAALILMEASLPGAAALIVAAAALAILAPVMVALGSLSWEDIAKGLVALAGMFVLIGAAGILLIPALPGLLGLGAAITLIGIGILAAGAGVALFGAGVVALAAGIAALGVAIATFVGSILGLLPTLSTTFTAVIVSFATGIAKAGPAIINALTVLLVSLLNAIIKITPTLVKAFETILTGIIELLSKDAPRIVTAVVSMVVSMLNALTSKVPAFTAAAVGLIVAILNGIAANVGKVVAAATNIAISFINAIGAAGLKIEAAGVTMIINFINGLARQINAETPALRSAGINLAEAIINGMTGGLLSSGGSITNTLVNLASSALSAAKSFLGIKSPSKRFHDEVGAPSGMGVVGGLLSTTDAIASASETVAGTALDSMKTALSGINDLVDTNLNANPTITPVVDLTQAQKGFNTLSSMTKNQLIAASTSSSVASSISASNTAAASALGTNQANGQSVTFNQYNTSPVALDEATIYRQTKNQLSVVKGALTS